MKLILTLCLCLASLTAAAAANCPTDSSFKQNGWTVSTDFKANYSALVEKLKLENNFFEFEVSQKFFSSVAKKWVEMTSYDDTRTPRSTMFGDLVIITSLSGEAVEVRWFDGNTKKLAYNKKLSPCSTHLIPFAENSLY